jgi:hypothetical protein
MKSLSLPEERDIDERMTEEPEAEAGAEAEAYSVNQVDYSVDISAAFPLVFQSRAGSASPGGERSTQPTARMHGRPLTLLSSMLGTAASTRSSSLPSTLMRRAILADDLDFARLIPSGMRGRLATAFTQLRTLHPHLQPLSDLFSLHREMPDDIAVQLLLAASVYVSLQALPWDSDARNVQDDLAPFVAHLTNLVLAQHPTSFHAIQALEVLALHAPLTPALPFQLADTRTVAPARGLISAARNISEQLNFNAFVNSRVERWPNPDYWLWLGLRVVESQAALEDERARKPALLAESRLSSAAMINPDSEALWLSPLSRDDPAELLGKLTICDRLARLDELHDCLGRLRGALDNAANIVNFKAATAVVDELQYYAYRMAAVDARHDDVLAMLALPPALTAGWVQYRTVRRRWENMKGCHAAFHTLIALHFIHGSVHAVPNLPDAFNAAQSVHHALSRAHDPNDILHVYATHSAAAEEAQRCLRLRCEFAEQQLASFLDISPSLMGGSDIVPIHDLVALTLEAAKTLLEAQATDIAFTRAIAAGAPPPPLPLPAWVPVLTQISHVLHKLAISKQYSDANANAGVGEDIASACGNIFGSMARTVHEWVAFLESDAGNQHHQSYHQLQVVSQASSGSFPGTPQPQPQRRVSDVPMRVDTNIFAALPHSYAPPFVADQQWEAQAQAQAQAAQAQVQAQAHAQAQAQAHAQAQSQAQVHAAAHAHAHAQAALTTPGGGFQLLPQVEYTPPPPHSVNMTPPPPGSSGSSGPGAGTGTGNSGAPPLTPLVTVSSAIAPPPPETSSYPAPPAAPATATATQTQNLDTLFEMFAYGYGQPSQNSAPPIAAPQVFLPLSPRQGTISPPDMFQGVLPQ